MIDTTLETIFVHKTQIVSWTMYHHTLTIRNLITDVIVYDDFDTPNYLEGRHDTDPTKQ